MAITSSCCFNLTNLTSTTKINTQVAPLFRDEKKWRRRCMTGMAACVVILGGEMGFNQTAMAAQEAPVVQELKGSKWSDKRKCPPWQQNSLETIVPENLPRPSAHRKWEGVGYSKTAPSVDVSSEEEPTAVVSPCSLELNINL